MPMRRVAAWLLLSVLFAGRPALASDHDDLLIAGARLLDGTGAPPVEAVSVLIRDGRIQAIGRDLAAPAARVIDAQGLTVLPGLIDAHIHLAAAPGSAFRNDTPERVQELNRAHLRAYLANGVTTVLDPGSPLDMVTAAQAWLTQGHPGPRYLTTGPMLRVPGGYGAEEHGALHSPQDVRAALDRIQAIGGVGIKLSTERGFSPLSRLPSYPPEIREAIVAEAAHRGLPIYVHAMNESDAEEALALGAHAIMHAPMGGLWKGDLFGVRALSDRFIAEMKESGAYQLTTFSLIDTWPGGFDARRLEDPLLRLSVPAAELATASDPEALRFFAIYGIGYAAPWTFEFLRPWLGRMLWRATSLQAALRHSQREVLRLHRAGVPIVVATDAPSPWPAAIFHFHGPQTAREIELLAEAGLTPLEAIRAATQVAARMLGLEREIGTIEPGKRADLLLVAGDPAADVRALREVRFTVKDGVARTPAEWMDAGLSASRAAPRAPRPSPPGAWSR
jgi:imidazolonepropionase-like amidohydrolase